MYYIVKNISFNEKKHSIKLTVADSNLTPHTYRTVEYIRPEDDFKLETCKLLANIEDGDYQLRTNNKNFNYAAFVSIANTHKALELEDDQLLYRFFYSDKVPAYERDAIVDLLYTEFITLYNAPEPEGLYCLKLETENDIRIIKPVSNTSYRFININNKDTFFRYSKNAHKWMYTYKQAVVKALGWNAEVVPVTIA